MKIGKNGESSWVVIIIIITTADNLSLVILLEVCAVAFVARYMIPLALCESECSVSVDSALPSVQHLLVVVFFSLDASLVLELSQFGGSFLVHHLLQLASHGAVTLAHLAKHISLMHLLHHARLDHLLLVGLVLSFDLCLHVLALELLHPLGLLLELLLQFNVLLAVSIHILKQVNARLVLPVPLLLTGFPLLGVLFSYEFVNHLLVGLLVLSDLLRVLLELDCLGAVLHSLLILKLLQCLLVFEGRVEQLQVALLLRQLRLLTKKFLLLVMFNKSKVALTEQDMALFLNLLLALSLDLPLFLEHLTLGFQIEFVLILLLLLRGALPVQNCQSVCVELCLFFGFSDLALKFLLSVEGVKLGINLLLEHALLNLTTFVNQLLLALNLGTHYVELAILLSQGVVGHFEFLVELALDKGLAFGFTLSLKSLQTFKHCLTDLFWSFLLVVEFLLVHTVFSSEERREFLTSLLEVGSVLSTHLFEAAFDDLLCNDLVGFVFPLGSEGEVLVTVDVGEVFLQLLRHSNNTNKLW